jgi:hypothetical protein
MSRLILLAIPLLAGCSAIGGIEIEDINGGVSTSESSDGGSHGDDGDDGQTAGATTSQDEDEGEGGEDDGGPPPPPVACGTVSSPPTHFTTSGEAITHLAGNGSEAAWGNAHELTYLDASFNATQVGGPLTGGPDSLSDVILTDDRLYYADAGLVGGSGGIFAWNPLTTAQTAIDENTVDAAALILTESFLFAAVHPAGPEQHQFDRYALDGSTLEPAVIPEGPGRVLQAGSYLDSLFWTARQGESDAIYVAHAPDYAPLMLEDTLSQTGELVLRDSSVLTRDLTDDVGSLVEVALDGTGTVDVQTDIKPAGALARNTECVFWANETETDEWEVVGWELDPDEVYVLGTLPFEPTTMTWMKDQLWVGDAVGTIYRF